MSRLNLKAFCNFAESYGSNVSREMVNAVANSANQAEAVRAIMAGLNDAFNLQDDPVKHRIAAGFAVGIVNVMERGLEAIHEDGEVDHAPA